MGQRGQNERQCSLSWKVEMGKYVFQTSKQLCSSRGNREPILSTALLKNAIFVLFCSLRLQPRCFKRSGWNDGWNPITYLCWHNAFGIELSGKSEQVKSLGPHVLSRGTDVEPEMTMESLNLWGFNTGTYNNGVRLEGVTGKILTNAFKLVEEVCVRPSLKQARNQKP